MKKCFALFLVLFAFSANAMISPEKVYQKVNKVREKQGVPALNWDNTLANLALIRAKEIYDTKNWSHESPRGKEKYGTSTAYDLWGENLARKFRNSDNMVQAWQKSKTHNDNLVRDFTDTGIGTYGNVTVQLFGRRKKPTKLGSFDPKTQVKTTTPSKLKRK